MRPLCPLALDGWHGHTRLARGNNGKVYSLFPASCCLMKKNSSAARDSGKRAILLWKIFEKVRIGN